MNKSMIDRIGEVLNRNHLDAILITPSEDLTSIVATEIMQCERFQGLVIKKDGTVFYICNVLYGVEVMEFMKDHGKIYMWHDDTSYINEAKRAFEEHGLMNAKIAVNLNARLENLYPIAQASGSSFVPGKLLLEEVRIIKSTTELQRLRRASKLSDEVLLALFEKIGPGVSESEIRNTMQELFSDRGIGPEAFGGVIATGSNTALPHYFGSSRVLEREDILMIDFGCCYKGMNADTTRTVFIGSITAKQIEVYKVVQEANFQAEQIAVEGAYIPDICMAARKVIEKAGYGEYFNHRLGHGIGSYLHESPEITIRNENILKRGMAFTIEPGIYLPGEFGVRIEDVVLINELGKRDVLNTTSKELTIL
jgi:Xaa-Pro dipeptidase